MFGIASTNASTAEKPLTLKWLRHRHEITRLYRDRDYELEDVAKHMQKFRGFIARLETHRVLTSIDQYIEKLGQWRVRKHRYSTRQQREINLESKVELALAKFDKCPELVHSSDPMNGLTQSSADTELSVPDRDWSQSWRQCLIPLESQFVEAEYSTFLDAKSIELQKEHQNMWPETVKANNECRSLDRLVEQQVNEITDASPPFKASNTIVSPPEVMILSSPTTSSLDHVQTICSQVAYEFDTSQAESSSNDGLADSDSSHWASVSDEGENVLNRIIVEAETQLLPSFCKQISLLIRLENTSPRGTTDQLLIDQSNSTRYRLTSRPSCYGTASNDTTGTANTQNSSLSNGSNNLKRKRGKKNNDDDDDHDARKNNASGDWDPFKHQWSAVKQKIQKLACPYHKLNPQKFRSLPGNRKYKTCPRGFVDTKDLSEHLKRVHSGPKYWCRRCSAEFKDPYKEEEHAKTEIPCSPFENPEFVEEGYIMTAEKKQALKKKSHSSSVEDHWLGIWKVLFPNFPRPASIHQEMLDVKMMLHQAVDEVVPSFAQRRVTDLRPHSIDVREVEDFLRKVTDAVIELFWDHIETSHISTGEILQSQSYECSEMLQMAATSRFTNETIIPCSQGNAYAGIESSNSQQDTGEIFDSSAGFSDLDFPPWSTEFKLPELATVDESEETELFSHGYSGLFIPGTPDVGYAL